jgi:hypothetical protein
MDPATATVAAALINFSGQVLVAVISKRESKPAPRSYPEPAKILDHEGVKKIMSQAQGHFRDLSSHIERATETILKEQERVRVTNIIDNLRAEVSAITEELQASASDPEQYGSLRRKRLNAAISRLRAAMHLAQITLSEAHREDLGRLCYIAGASALLSVSEYLGLPEHSVLENLKSTARLVQRELLNDLAYKISNRSPNVKAY